MALTKTHNRMIKGASYNVLDFGAVGDGVADDTAAIQAALDAANSFQTSNPSSFVTVLGAGLKYSVSSTLNLAYNIMFDGQGCEVVAAMDDHVFEVKRNACIWNTVVDASGIAFSNGKAAFRFNHTDNTQGHRSTLPVFMNCKAKLPSAYTGTGFLINASTYYVQYLRMENLTVQNGNIGLHFQGASTSTQYCNGNSVDGLTIFDSSIGMKFDFASGNTVTNVAAEKNTNPATIKLANSSKGNRVTGIRWDSADISFDGTSDENFIDVMHSGNAASVDDLGRNNTVTFSGGRKVANTSVDFGNDTRGFLQNPGLIEFKDQLAGGVSPYWTQTIDAGAAIVYSQAFEGSASDNTQWTKKAELRSLSSGTCRLDFNDIPFVVPENNFRLHLIFSANNTATSRARIGAMGVGSANGIYFEKDAVAYGDDNWRLVVSKTGTATVVDLGVANTSSQIWYATIEVSPTSVFYSVGKYVSTASNDDGRIGRNIDAVWATTRSTHVAQGTVSTNVPDGLAMQPVVECEDATNSGKIELISYHLVGGYRADNT